MCDDLTGRDDSAGVLEHLEARTFPLPLDNRREWFRYHVLFAEVLRLSLKVQELIELHRRAAAWFESHGWPESAAHHRPSRGRGFFPRRTWAVGPRPRPGR